MEHTKTRSFIRLQRRPFGEKSAHSLSVSSRKSEKRLLDPPWPIEGSIETLVKTAVLLLIFAATVCGFLAEANHKPPARLEDRLAYNAQDIPQQDLTYLPILNHLLVTRNAHPFSLG